MNTWTRELKRLRACPEALVWVDKQESWEVAWQVCQRGDWMLWLAGKLSGPPESEGRKKLVLAACACARLALPYVKAGELRPLRAIETAEAWARGEATIAQVRRDASAADAAYASAYAAYASAYAAYASAYAAYADAAASAYAYASDAAANAQQQVLAQCADIVRQHYPQAPALGKEGT